MHTDKMWFWRTQFFNNLQIFQIEILTQFFHLQQLTSNKSQAQWEWKMMKFKNGSKVQFCELNTENYPTAIIKIKNIYMYQHQINEQELKLSFFI